MKNILLTPIARRLIAEKLELAKQGELARADLAAIVGCLVEQAGKRPGTYLISADGSMLIPAPAAPKPEKS